MPYDYTEYEKVKHCAKCLHFKNLGCDCDCDKGTLKAINCINYNYVNFIPAKLPTLQTNDNWYGRRKYLLKLASALCMKYCKIQWHEIEKETNEHILNTCYKIAGTGWINIAEELINK